MLMWTRSHMFSSTAELREAAVLRMAGLQCEPSRVWCWAGGPAGSSRGRGQYRAARVRGGLSTWMLSRQSPTQRHSGRVQDGTHPMLNMTVLSIVWIELVPARGADQRGGLAPGTAGSRDMAFLARQATYQGL